MNSYLFTNLLLSYSSFCSPMLSCMDATPNVIFCLYTPFKFDLLILQPNPPLLFEGFILLELEFDIDRLGKVTEGMLEPWAF